MYTREEFLKQVNSKLPPGVPRLEADLLNGFIQRGMIETLNGFIPHGEVAKTIRTLGLLRETAENMLKETAESFKTGSVRRCQIAHWYPVGKQDEVIRRAIRDRHVWYHAATIDVNRRVNGKYEEDNLETYPEPEYLPELGIYDELAPFLQVALLPYRRGNIVLPGVPRTQIVIQNVDYVLSDEPADVSIDFLQKRIESQSDVYKLEERSKYWWAYYPPDMLKKEQSKMMQFLSDAAADKLTLMALDELRPTFEQGLYWHVPPTDKWPSYENIEDLDNPPELIPVYRFYSLIDYCWFRLIEDIERQIVPRLCKNCGLPLAPDARSNRKYHHKDENPECYRDWRRRAKQRERQSR